MWDQFVSVSLSGGKDSTALLLMLVERGWRFDEVLFFDTGWEFPEMYAHLDRLERYLSLEITRLKANRNFLTWMLTHGIAPRKGPDAGKIHKVGYGWPGPKMRWCTREKTDTINRHLRQARKTLGVKEFVSYVGFAADEPGRAEKKKKYLVRYPLIEWGVTEAQALQYCYDRGFDWGGLYEEFGRVSCYCCPLQPIEGLRKLRKLRPHMWEQMLYWGTQTRVDAPFKQKKPIAAWEERFRREDREVLRKIIGAV